MVSQYFTKYFNNEFSHIEIWLTDQFSKPLEIEDNVNLTLIISQRVKMRYSTEPRFRKYVKSYGFLSFAKNLVINMVKNLMGTAAMEAAKITS